MPTRYAIDFERDVAYIRQVSRVFLPDRLRWELIRAVLLRAAIVFDLLRRCEFEVVQLEGGEYALRHVVSGRTIVPGSDEV